MKTITVIDLSNPGRKSVYMSSPVEAVIHAYESSQGNHNTWNYQNHDHPRLKFGPSGRTVFCGDFGTVIKGELDMVQEVNLEYDRNAVQSSMNIGWACKVSSIDGEYLGNISFRRFAPAVPVFGGYPKVRFFVVGERFYPPLKDKVHVDLSESDSVWFPFQIEGRQEWETKRIENAIFSLADSMGWKIKSIVHKLPTPRDWQVFPGRVISIDETESEPGVVY